MKSRVLSGGVAGVLAFAGPALGIAQAQDRGRDLPAFNSGPTWTGFYIGAGVGTSIQEGNLASTSGGTSITVDRTSGQGALAAIYGGVDYQILPRAVVGVLVEGTWSNSQGVATAQIGSSLTANITRQTDLGWSAVARAGVLATPSTLLYLMGGYSGQNFHTWGNANAGGNFASFDRNEYFNGWTIGTGLETLLGGGWSTKLEYRYSQFESKTAPGSTFAFTPVLHTVRAGLTYRFGAGGADDSSQSSEMRHDWTGIYVGGGGGAAATRNHLTASFGNASASTDEGGQNLLGTVFGGYDWQVGERAVVGFLGDVSWAGPQSTSTVSAGGATLQIIETAHMSWSALGRLGFLPTPSTLLYAAGGYTGQYVTTVANATVGTLTANLRQDDVINGWTVGPGIETVIFGGWTTRLEYRYSQYEQKAFAGGGASFQPTTQSVRLGLSYKFGPGSAPK